MLVGIGPHSKRIHLPLIEEYRDRFNIKLKAAVDISKNKEETHNYLKKNWG